MLRILVALSALIAVATAGGVSLRRASPFGIVGGIRDCGSAGRLGDVAVTDCTQTPCHLVPGKNYDISIKLISQTTSSTLSLHVYHADSEVLLLDSPINGEVKEGIEYELKFVLPVTNLYEGTAFNIRFYILDLQTQKVEICAAAALTIGWST